MNVHFMSKTDDWATPQKLFDELNSEFGFTLDPCATLTNAKCSKFYTRENDGLSKDWRGERVFMNPPYGREIGKWVKKISEEGGGSSPTRAHRYPLVSRIYTRESGGTIPARSFEVWWLKKLGPVS